MLCLHIFFLITFSEVISVHVFLDFRAMIVDMDQFASQTIQIHARTVEFAGNIT